MRAFGWCEELGRGTRAVGLGTLSAGPPTDGMAAAGPHPGGPQTLVEPIPQIFHPGEPQSLGEPIPQGLHPGGPRPWGPHPAGPLPWRPQLGVGRGPALGGASLRGCIPSGGPFPERPHPLGVCILRGQHLFSSSLCREKQPCQGGFLLVDLSVFRVAEIRLLGTNSCVAKVCSSSFQIRVLTQQVSDLRRHPDPTLCSIKTSTRSNRARKWHQQTE